MTFFNFTLLVLSYFGAALVFIVIPAAILFLIYAWLREYVFPYREHLHDKEND